MTIYSVLTPVGRYGALTDDHPAVTKPNICVFCDKPLVVGDVPSLIEKPDGDHDGLTREAMIVHEDCVYRSSRQLFISQEDT